MGTSLRSAILKKIKEKENGKSIMKMEHWV